MKKISRKGFLKVAAAAAMSGVTASALAACNAGSSSSTAASTGEAIYTPGTYTGTATGIGEVKVTMTFSETAITDVVIDASNETESIGGVAAPTLKDALMAAQSTEIDNISGATITTNAVKKAAASCIEQAMGVHTAGGDTAASSSDEDWLGTEPEIDESKVAKTVDVDVAVVGCGIAGVAACRSVAEDGGLVAAFEKADGLTNQLTVLEQQQGGDAHDAELGGQIGLLVHIDLAHLDVGALLGHLVHDGAQHPAGAAPGGPEIEQDRLSALQHLGLKVFFRDGDDCHIVSLHKERFFI